MSEDGFYIATRIVNPVLVKLRSLVASTYGLRSLDESVFHLSHHDLAVHNELERLRDELAMNRITKNDYVREIREMLRKYPNMSLQTYQILDELHTALTGQSLTPLISQQAREINTSVRVETAKIVSSTAGAEGRRRCPRCGDQIHFLTYLLRYYCFNCKTYIE